MKNIYFATLAVFATAVPVIASAQGISDTINTVGRLISSLIPIVIGIAVLVFLWGLVQFVVADGEEKQTKARNTILWGIIILFVMVAIWGLVDLLGETLGIDTDSSAVPRAPGIPQR
jgi:hypothetical protein